MAREIRVRSMREVPVLGTDGRPTVEVHVEFSYGDLGPFTHRMPKAQFSGQMMRQQLEAIGREAEIVAGPEPQGR
jgi:hypothetical protein